MREIKIQNSNIYIKEMNIGGSPEYKLGSDNLALKTNIAEISEDKNEYDVPDIDSTPDNKKDGEDDIDIAKVILAVSTGRAQTYFTLTLGLLVVMVIGIALIRRFVI